MSQPIIAQSDTFGTWLEKTNDISRNVGDPDNLTTLVTTDLVSAINSISSDTKDRGGLNKDANGELYADVDDNSLNVSNNNKLQIKNDGVQAKHINKDVVGDGLRQLQNETIAVAPDASTITTIDGKIAIKDGGVTSNKLALNTPGTVITWAADRTATYVTPATAGEVLTAQESGLPAHWKISPGTILGYSGYIAVGNFSNTRGSDTVEITIQSLKNLTTISNLVPFPGGYKTSGTTEESDDGPGAEDFYTEMSVTASDANYGFVWNTDQGIVTLRAFDVYAGCQNGNHEDDGAGTRETIVYGMKLFNVNDVTFISFKVKSHNMSLARQALKFFFVAELMSNPTSPTPTYYTNDGTTAITDWTSNTDYTLNDVVKSNNKLYKNVTPGTTRSSGSAGAPSHTYYDAGVVLGTATKQYANTSWKFIGEI